MEIKPVSGCLNFIDNMILYNIEKRDIMVNLEIVLKYILDDYINKSEKESILYYVLFIK